MILLFQMLGPHQDTALSILCAQRNPSCFSQNYAQIHAVATKLALNKDKKIRASITRVNKNELTALEISAVVNKAAVACFLTEIIYNIIENIEDALKLINRQVNHSF